VYVPHDESLFQSILSLNLSEVKRLIKLGLNGYGSSMPKHVDNIDVLVSPFLVGGKYLLDYHVPMDIELKWLGMTSLARITQILMPKLVKSASVVIAPNKAMLNHAFKYGETANAFIIPNYPLKRFKVDIAKEVARAKLGIPENSRMVLSVCAGRVREIYGIDFLLQTWIKVAKEVEGTELYLIGATTELGYSKSLEKHLEAYGVHFIGNISHNDVAYWIAASDVCVSQRTPGFPVNFYNIYDSLKLSEYASFEKPIVAAGYSNCDDYLSPKTTVSEFSRDIKRALNGDAPKPQPHFWEENEQHIIDAYNLLYE
jgi:glycosyltransferase involved in cell wall biosynthesis